MARIGFEHPSNLNDLPSEVASEAIKHAERFADGIAKMTENIVFLRRVVDLALEAGIQIPNFTASDFLKVSHSMTNPMASMLRLQVEISQLQSTIEKYAESVQD